VPAVVAVDRSEADAGRVQLVAHAGGEIAEVVREHGLDHRARDRPDAPVRRDRFVVAGRAVAVERAHALALPARQTRHTGRVSSRDRLAVALATVQDFADRAGAQRVVVLLDGGAGEPPVMVERREDGALEVTAGETTHAAAPAPGVAPLPLPPLRPLPPSALSADPESGELAAPLGAIQRLADSVLALARALGGRSVATATFATRDPEIPLTVAARAGEPVVLDIAGRHFSFPG
jgi:hypothetical protein